jgi:hypothetical protein
MNYYGKDTNNKSEWLGPVAISGGGGSGTRVVAEILKKVNFYIGSDLNSANDNLWFTFLFKRPKWFIKNSDTKLEIFKGLSLFEKAMTGSLCPQFDEFNFMMKAALKMVLNEHTYLREGNKLWPIKRVINMVKAKNHNLSGYIGWGWKEPNTHIYIEYLCNHFNNLHYIHVIRHGLDMAYSSNQNQLYNWGKIFGIEVPDSQKLIPRASLNYWIESNKRATTLGKTLLNERFFIVNFDKLCLNPEHEINLLINFLGIDTKYVNMDELKMLPVLPKSMGRYKNYDITIFSKDEIDAVKKFGFVVDT